MDILRPTGFKLALGLAARLRPAGLVWAAPPCSTWVFLSSSTTGRAIDPAGDPANFAVQSQNALVMRLLLISALVRERGGVFLWEQPHSTRMWKLPPIRDFIRKCPDVKLTKLHMGAYGAASEKETWLMGNAPYVGDFARMLSPGERSLVRSSHAKAQTALRYVDSQGHKRVQGGPDLKGTQSYPLGFGAAHGHAYLEWRQRAPAPPGLAAPAGLLDNPRPWCLMDVEVGATLRWHSAAELEEALPLRDRSTRCRSRSPGSAAAAGRAHQQRG